MFFSIVMVIIDSVEDNPPKPDNLHSNDILSILQELNLKVHQACDH